MLASTLFARLAACGEATRFANCAATIAAAACLGACQTAPVDVTTRAPAVEDRSSSGWLTCPADGSLSDADVAQSLRISVATLKQIHQNRRRSTAELCSMTPEKLTREVGRARIERPVGPSDQDYRLSRFRNGDGTIEPMPALRLSNARVTLERERSSLAAVELPSDVVWQNIGPGNTGGRIRSIAVDTTDRNRIFVGAVTGGIWYSPDAGQSWTNVTDSLGNVGIMWIEQDPNDPATFYATTGEQGLGSHGANYGIGILASRDRGLTWSMLSATASSAAARRLVGIPGMPNVLVTTNAHYGIHRSVDGGVTWTQVRPSENVFWHNTNFPSLPFEIVVDPANPSHLIAGDYFGGVTHSYDAGATWTARIQLPVTPEPGYGNRVELSFAPSQPGLLYAAVSPGNLGNGMLNDPYQTRLFRSADNGKNWTLVGYVVPASFAASYRNGNGNYNLMLWVDPADAKHIVAGDVVAFRSTDGGQTWSGAVVPGSTLHVDQHLAVSDPGYNGTTIRRLWLVNDGGVYRTEDIAHSPSFSLNSMLPITQYYAVSGGTGLGGFLLGGSQDNGTHKVQGIAGDNSAVTVGPGDGFTSVIDPAGSGFYATSQSGYMVRFSDSIGYEYFWNGYPGESSTFATFIRLDPNHRDRLLMAGNSLWLSTNPWAAQPTRRTILAADADPANYLVAFAVAPTNSNVIWALRVSNGVLHRTTNGLSGQPTWQTFSLPVGQARATYIYADPANADVAYALYGGTQGKNVWRTVDGGGSWQDITGSLPGPAYVILRHPTHADWLYVGTESGLYYSADAGATWYASESGPRNVAVEDLLWYDNETLIAATYGRGLYKATVPKGTTIGLASSANPVTEGRSATYAAAVSGNAPGGFVTFTDAGAAIAGCESVALAGTGNVRSASCVTGGLIAGVHPIVASYGGDSVNAGSTSETLYEIVGYATTGNSVQFASSAYGVNEDAGAASLSVIRFGDVSAPASVNLNVIPRTAAAGADFTASSVRLDWPAGDSSPRTVSVTVANDTQAEGEESFEAVLTGPVGAALGPRSSAIVTISDDDSAVPGMPSLGAVVNSRYGALGVQGANLAGNTITGMQKLTEIRLGSVAGAAGSFAQIDFQGLSIAAGNTLVVRSGAPGQTLLLRSADASASHIAGAIRAVGGNGAAPPIVYLQNPAGITVAASGRIDAPSGLSLDTLDGTGANGTALINDGTISGASSLRLLAARITGGGSFAGNSITLSTFGNANNPVNGSHFLANGLRLFPGSGNVVALTLNDYGVVPQILNVLVHGDATVQMPSQWAPGSSMPPNAAPLAFGAVRPPGGSEPSYGGGSMIVQATGSLTLSGGASDDFVFPGGIVLKAGGKLDVNGVVINQGWTTSGKAFQGVFVESPEIVSSTGDIRVLSNNLNWINFSTRPHAPVRTWTLVQGSDGSAAYLAADDFAPHLNIYSLQTETAAAGGCYLCLVVMPPMAVH